MQIFAEANSIIKNIGWILIKTIKFMLQIPFFPHMSYHFVSLIIFNFYVFPDKVVSNIDILVYPTKTY